METKVYILCIDDYPRVAHETPPGLKGVRLLDATNMREVGRADVGAWPGYEPAIGAAVRDAIERGGL